MTDGGGINELFFFPLDQGLREWFVEDKSSNQDRSYTNLCVKVIVKGDR